MQASAASGQISGKVGLPGMVKLAWVFQRRGVARAPAAARTAAVCCLQALAEHRNARSGRGIVRWFYGEGARGPKSPETTARLRSVSKNIDSLVIIVNYGQMSYALRFAAQLRQRSEKENTCTHIVLADNSGESAEYKDKMRSQKGCSLFDKIFVLPNVGYFPAAHEALKKYIEMHRSVPKCVVVSNPDIVLSEEASFGRLSFLCDQPGVGVLAPRIVSLLDKIEQNPYMSERPSLWKLRVLRAIFDNTYSGMVYEKVSALKRRIRFALQGKRKKAPGSAKDIYAPHGAMVVFSRKFFERGGHLKHRAALFGEEIFVAEQCRRLGLRVRYDPATVVFHDEHSSTGRLAPAVRCRRTVEGLEAAIRALEAAQRSDTESPLRRKATG